jgi:polyhydroxyalkanoate synthesis regulator phasin
MRVFVILLTLFVTTPPSAVDAQDNPNQERVDFDELAAKLKSAVKAGKLTEGEAAEKHKAAASNQQGLPSKSDGKKGENADPLSEFTTKLKALVEAGKLTKEEATELYQSVARIASKSGRDSKTIGKFKKRSLAEQIQLSQTLPTTSTPGDQEGPVATGFFGWAAESTHRFMDNSHQGEPRKIHGMSFRLDYRNHDTIGRTWDNVSVRIAHGDWSSLKYNASNKFSLVDEATVAFDKPWSFPTLTGFPALEPAEWGGPQNCLNFRFDQPFEYNGKDAIFVEFVFSGGKAEDGRRWEGDLPYGFEYFLDSMPEEGGWRVPEPAQGLYRAPRVEAAVSYSTGSQSVWTSAAKGMPYIQWDFQK